MIAVIGAGGSTGLECVKRLCDQGKPVRAVVRSPAKYEGKFPERAEIVAGDVTDEASLRTALAGCTGVIFAASALGKGSSNDAVCHLGALSTARIAKEMNAKVVLITSRMVNGDVFGWSPIRMFLNTLTWGGMDAKMQGENAVRASGANYCIIRPGGLVYGEGGSTHGSTKLSPAGGDFVIATQADSRSGVTEYQINRVDVAAATVAALERSDTKGKTIELVARAREESDPPFEQHLETLFKEIPQDEVVYPFFASNPTFRSEEEQNGNMSCKRRVRRCTGAT